MRFRLPRNTVRLRLTFLYGSLFLLSGAGLLAITYVLVRSTGIVVTWHYHKTGVPHGPSKLPPLPALSSQARSYAAAQRASVLHNLLAYSGIALGIMALASVFLGWLVAGWVLRPLRTIIGSVQDISASNLHDRLLIDGPDDELKELAVTFNGLLARLESAFEAQRQFVANASHELRTPLARERTVMEVALRDPNATVESLRAAGERVLASGEHQERLIEALLTLARSQRGIVYREALDLREIAHSVLTTRRQEIDSRHLRLSAALAPAPTHGDPRLTERLVANLVDNAIRHNRPEGEIQISTGEVQGWALISVANTGPQILPSQIRRLLLPFQRLSNGRADHHNPGSGLGLGLSIVHAIAQAHDAECVLAPGAGGGLVAEVRFPSGAVAGPPHHGAIHSEKAPIRQEKAVAQ